MATDTSAAWQRRLESAGVPCGPINTFSETFSDPQVVHRKLRVDLPLSTGGTCPGIASPMRFSETPLDHAIGPPVLGEHTQDVLTQRLGLSDAALAQLRAAGVV
ncbi:Formyl-CoA:oxalate CoA-transferase [compost metagenome]